MERGLRFERDPSRREEPKIEIISAEGKTEPKKRPNDRILTLEEINEKINRGKKRFEEEVTLYAPSSKVIAYPSGLILVFEPCFYEGKPYIETFAGFYSCHLVVPKEYDPEGKQDMSDEVIRKRLAVGRKITLNPKIFERTLSEPAREKIPLNQGVGFVLADEFAVGYFAPLKIWIVLLDQKALKESERNVFPILHELGHILYSSSIIDELIKAVLQEEQEGNKHTDEYDKFIKGASQFILALREDLQKLKPELKIQILEALQYVPCDPIIQRYIEGMPKIAEGVLLQQQKEVIEAGDSATAETIQRILTTILVFSERMADARAAALARRLRKKGIKLGFASSDDLINFYHKALKSYAEAHSDPRFLTGFRRKRDSQN